jgi:hypothetical protein
LLAFLGGASAAAVAGANPNSRFINRRISITALAHEFPQPLSRSRYVGKSSQAAVLMIMPILDLAMK